MFVRPKCDMCVGRVDESEVTRLAALIHRIVARDRTLSMPQLVEVWREGGGAADTKRFVCEMASAR